VQKKKVNNKISDDTFNLCYICVICQIKLHLIFASGYFIDQRGQHVKGPVDDRMIGVTLEQFRGAKSGILIAGGQTKLNAIRATLNGDYVSHLVVDNHTAQWLLEVDEATE